MSFALQATILLVVDARKGYWCPLSWLSKHLAAPQGMVNIAAEVIVAQSELSSQVIDGQLCLGAHVDGKSPMVA